MKRSFDFDRAAALYLLGASLSEVAQQVGASSDELVRKALKSMGVPRRRRGGGNGCANHQFKGGKRQRKDGYWIERGTREKPLEHRRIAERALGRKLKRNEDVHHVNCRKADNTPTNLVICTHAYHMELHARMRRHPYWMAIEQAAKRESKK